jgi:hypothetical protein
MPLTGTLSPEEDDVTHRELAPSTPPSANCDHVTLLSVMDADAIESLRQRYKREALAAIEKARADAEAGSARAAAEAAAALEEERAGRRAEVCVGCAALSTAHTGGGRARHGRSALWRCRNRT